MKIVPTSSPSTRLVSPSPGGKKRGEREQHVSSLFSFSTDESRSDVPGTKANDGNDEPGPHHGVGSRNPSEEFLRASTQEPPISVKIYENLRTGSTKAACVRLTVHGTEGLEHSDRDDHSRRSSPIIRPSNENETLSSLQITTHHSSEVTLSLQGRVRTTIRFSPSSFMDPFPTPTATTASGQDMECRERQYGALREENETSELNGAVNATTAVAFSVRSLSFKSTTTDSTGECSESDTEFSADHTVLTAAVATPASAALSPTDNNLVVGKEITNPCSSSLRQRRQIFLPSPQQRQRAAKALRSSIQNTSKRIQNTSKRIRKLRPRNIPPPKTWLIPADHPLKVAWNVCTVCLSLVSAYLTHTSIRERDYDRTGFLIRFCEVWFLVDILLNFVTQYRVSGKVTLACPQKVWARYLTTWFIIDVISFIPFEKIWVKPIVEMQKRRNIIQKTGRRSKVVLKIARMLRGRHVRWFNNVSRLTKHAGYGGNRLLALIIKYIPKYFVFCKNMKTVLAVRMLRQIHWVRKVMKHVFWKYKVEEEALEEVLEEEEDEEEDELEMEDETGIESFETEEEEHEHEDVTYEPPIS